MLIVGVLRAVVDADSGDEIVSEGNLWVEPADEAEEIRGQIVLYTVDQNRLLEMLGAARAGASDDDIMLALDAAALATSDFDDDGDVVD